MFSVNARQTGDPKRALELTDKRYWQRVTRDIRSTILMNLGEEYIKKLKDAVMSGEVGGPALSDKWVERKGHGVKWLDKGELLDALQVFPIGSGRFFAGIPLEARNENGNLLVLVAVGNEVGTVFTSPRPVFEPIAQKLLRDKKELKGMLEAVLEKEVG